MSLRSALLLGLAMVLLAGCTGTRKLTYDSAEEAFKKGQAAYEAEEYDRAIRYFRAVFNYGRGNEWADDAQLYLARAYRVDERYALAATEYQRFLQLYPTDERVPIAEFERAMSFYARSPTFQFDQTYTRRALRAFQLFIDRYPQHELIPKAEARIEELKEKLAHRQYYAAYQYERRELWEAAALAYMRTFDQFPETSWADDALLGAIRMYIEFADRSIRSKQADRYREALEAYRTLYQIFPESPLLDRAEALYQEASTKLSALEGNQSLAETNGTGDGQA